MEGNKLNPFVVLKSRSSADKRQYGSIVEKVYEAISTASQTIINLGFSVRQDTDVTFELFIDGKIKREGISEDYTFTSIANGVSSEITLSVALSAGLNIKAILFGLKELNSTGASFSSGAGIATGGSASTKTADYTTVDGDKDKIIPVDSSSVSLNITLHNPSTNPFFITVKDINGSADNNYINVFGTFNDGFSDSINKAFGALTFEWNGTSWYRIASYKKADLLPKGLFGGGTSGSYSSAIDYIDITTLGNASSFGSLSVARGILGACASSIRGIWGGGTTGSNSNVIDYITVRTSGNATDFGDLITAQNELAAGGNNIHGIFFGGTTSTTTMEHIYNATLGNATSFGSLSAGSLGGSAAGSSSRLVIHIGNSSSIEYLTIATTGSGSSFGSLLGTRRYSGSGSSQTRYLIMGGDTNSAGEYVTIATLGNSASFGALTVARGGTAGCSSYIRAVCAGGGAYSNVIDYFTIASIGAATDFGDLTVARTYVAGCSSSHGGL